MASVTAIMQNVLCDKNNRHKNITPLYNISRKMN